MRNLRILKLVILITIYPLSGSSQEDGLSIVQKASEACKILNSVKYFINKTPVVDSSERSSFKGSIRLSKNASIKNPIFSGYLYQCEIDILGNDGKKLKVTASYDGENLYIKRGTELTKFANPSSQTIMRKLGFELYLLIFHGFTKPDGLDFLIERALTREPDTLINGVPSYHIKATSSFPISPGSSEERKTTSDWFFATHDNLPIGYRDNNYFSTIQILEKNFKTDPNDFAILDNDQLTFSAKSNKDVQEENLLGDGSIAPDWTSKTLIGEYLKLSNLRGKIVLIDFWGTWCPPCIRSMPNIQKIHEKYNDVMVIGIAVKDEPLKVKKFIYKNEFSYTIIPEGTDIAKLYNVAEYPT